MKSRTNQPIYKDDGTLFSDTQLDNDISSQAQFENIVDKDGHKRFIEGDVELTETLPSGVTKTYGKWSLSGSHLMIVVAGNFADGTSIPYGNFCVINLPDWIKDKIVPTYESYVFFTTQPAWASDSSTQNFTVRLVKDNNNVIYILNSAETMTKARSFRWAFDLLRQG